MITFDSLTLKAFVEEQNSFITGARINKIQQPTRREFIFTLRNNAETRQFYVNINPQFYHLCFMSKENAEKRFIEIPQKPPMFCMLLRKYLGNSRITKINQPENERILEFFIETYNELGDKVFLCLAFELMGKHSNVILYNDDTGIILGCAHNVGAEKSREREMYGGIPYIYPPKNNNSSCVWKSLIDEFSEITNVNDMIDNYYTAYISENKFKVLKNNYCSIVLQQLKKVNKSLKQMTYQVMQNSDSDKYRLRGDLIMANLYNLKDYSSEISVYDYENDKQIRIELDSTKTLKENANRFYKLYNKAKTSNTKLSELIDEANIKKANLEQILYSINSAEVISELYELTDEVIPEKAGGKSNKLSIEPIKLDLGGETRIYIGKNNKQNDYIISKLASEDDLWFHTKDCAGSHVLLKTQNVTDELILKCAELAKQYSSASDSSKIGVIYTKRKYLRKPPKANLGYVTYRNEKEIIIE